MHREIRLRRAAAIAAALILGGCGTAGNEVMVFGTDNQVIAAQCDGTAEELDCRCVGRCQHGLLRPG